MIAHCETKVEIDVEPQTKKEKRNMEPSPPKKKIGQRSKVYFATDSGSKRSRHCAAWSYWHWKLV